MSENLQALLKEALLNNSYDYQAMHDTIKTSWMNSYSYLYYLQKANIAYEELFFYSNDKDSRDHTKVGKLHLDNLFYATFDVDYDLISVYTREQYRLSEFYQNKFTFEDMVYNPDIFFKIPIVIIDDKVIWDYKIAVKKDCTTFTLPFKKNFVLEDGRNEITDDVIYINHKIQIMVVDNIYYQRYTFNKSTLNFDASKKTISINKATMIDMSEKNINTMVNSKYLKKYNVKHVSDLTTEQKAEAHKEAQKCLKCVELPEQDGIMFGTLHLVNSVGRGYELGTELIEFEDDGKGSYVATLTDDIVTSLSNHGLNIYLSMVFMNRLYKHTFYDGNYINKVRADGGKLLVLEQSKDTPYEAPIPVEDFIIFRRESSTSGWYLEKNVNMLEMHYPNIYRLNDVNAVENNEYKFYYFYYPTPDLQYTVLFDFYFRFLLDIFQEKSMEEILNDIYYNKANLTQYTEDQKIAFKNLFKRVMDYSAFHYRYGDTDFLERYLKTDANRDKVPIEYKDETLKAWIKEDMWLLRDYVRTQNKIGSSYHLFTNTVNLSERVRYDTELEIGTKDMYTFEEPRYVFSFANERQFPELLDCRVFVDGILVGDVYQRRRLFMDYFYIPASYVTDDSYIELEIFPRYQFSKDVKFTSLDDSVEVSIAEPEENIYPTTADMMIFDDVDKTKLQRLNDIQYTQNKRLDMNGVIVDEEGFFVGESDLPDGSVGIEATVWVYNGETKKYPVYVFYDKDNAVIGMRTNKHYNTFTPVSSFRCYSDIPKGATHVKFTLYKNPSEEINLRALDVMVSFKFQPFYDYKSRYDNKYFKIVSHYDRGNFEFSSDDPEKKPVKFTRLSTFDISPTSEKVINVPLKIRFSKIPIMVRFTIDVAGYAYIDTGTDDFQFSTEYIRVFRNGRLIPKTRYRLLTNYERPRILFVEWFDIGDIVYIDITPYRYTQLLHKRNISKEETLINLKGIINKPFDIRYYDVYMNGRKLSLNNVFSITPWEITLVNLKSNYNLDIYEKERDWEYFGLDYNTMNYYFSFDDLISSGVVSDEEFCKLIKDKIDHDKDPRLNIYPNTFNEDPLDYSDVDMIYPIFFIFYYDELIPKTFVNPDVLQFSRDVMNSNFKEIMDYYETSSVAASTTDEERKRRANYPGVICLDPDIYINSTSTETPSMEMRVKDRVDDDGWYVDEDGNLVLDAEREKDTEEYSDKDNPLVYSMDKNLIANEQDADLSNGAVLVYEVGHIQDLSQEYLDAGVEINNEGNIDKKGDA